MKSSVLFLTAIVMGISIIPACGTDGGTDYVSSGVQAEGHTDDMNGVWHRPGKEDPLQNCVECHGSDLEGASVEVSCYYCHDNSDHNSKRDGVRHKSGSSNECKICHGPNNNGGLGPACDNCH